MHVTCHDHVVVEHEVAIFSEVLYSKPVRPVIRDSVIWRQVTEATSCPAARDFLIARADDSDRVGVVAVLVEVAADAGRP